MSGLQDNKSAAVYVNNLLISKGYIRESEQLILDQVVEDVDVERNSRRIINAFYSLLQTIDSDIQQREKLIQSSKDLRSQADKDRILVSNLQTKLSESQLKIASVIDESLVTRQKLSRLETDNKQLREELNRYRQGTQQLRSQVANEIRKRDLQVFKLKSRLQEVNRTRGTPRPSSASLFTGSYSTSYASSRPSEGEFVRLGATISELTQLNQALLSENSTCTVLLTHISRLVDNLSNDPKVRSNPEENVDQSALDVNVEEQEDVDYDQMTVPSTIERISRENDIGSNIINGIEYISKVINSPQFVPVSELEKKNLEIHLLRQELTKATASWQKAVDTMEEWRQYRDSTEIGLGVEKMM